MDSIAPILVTQVDELVCLSVDRLFVNLECSFIESIPTGLARYRTLLFKTLKYSGEPGEQWKSHTEVVCPTDTENFQ